MSNSVKKDLNISQPVNNNLTNIINSNISPIIISSLSSNIKTTPQVNQNNQNNVLSPKVNTYKSNEMRPEDIHRIKTKLDNMDPLKLIDDILDHSKKKTVEGKNQHVKTDVFLDTIKNIAKNNYMDNIKTNTISEIKLEFNKKIDDYTGASNLYIDKKNKENIEYKTQYLNAQNNIKDLELLVVNLRQEIKDEVQKNQRSTETIYQLTLKMNEFQKIKPVFEQFLKDFPNDNPEDIVKDVIEKKEAYYLLLENQTEQHENLYAIKKEHKEENNKYKIQLDEMINKLSAIEDEYKDRINNYQLEINNMKRELETYLVYKNDNIKMTSMLFKLYNMLIERFKVDRNINFTHTELQVEESDFKCNMFDNIEIFNYVKSMITLTSEEKSANVLREVIAYSNMMLRLYVDDGLKDKFRPKKCFLKIKKTFDGFVNEKIQLREQLTVEKDKVHYSEIEIIRLKNIIKEKDNQYNFLEKKFAEQFEEKNNIRNQKRQNFIIEKRTSMTHNRNSLSIDNTKNMNNINNINNAIKTSIPNFDYDTNTINNILTSNFSPTNMISTIRTRKNTENRPSSVANIRSNSTNDAKKKAFFITEDNQNTFKNITNNNKNKLKKGYGQITYGNTSTRPATSKPHNSSNTRPVSSIFNRTKSKTAITKFNPLTDDFNSLTEDDVEKNKVRFIEKNNTENINWERTMHLSKNKDKIYKQINSNQIKDRAFKILPEDAKAMENFVQHTNNLFFYKTKMNNKKPHLNADDYDLHKSKSNFLKKQKQMAKLVKKLDNVSSGITNLGKVDVELHSKVASHIDTLIKNLEKHEAHAVNEDKVNKVFTNFSSK